MEKVAAILPKQFREEAILYDKYHQTEFAPQDLSIYLPNLYHREADLVVIVVCPDSDERSGRASNGWRSTISSTNVAAMK